MNIRELNVGTKVYIRPSVKDDKPSDCWGEVVKMKGIRARVLVGGELFYIKQDRLIPGNEFDNYIAARKRWNDFFKVVGLVVIIALGLRLLVLYL